MRKAEVDMDLLMEKNPPSHNDPTVLDSSLKSEYPQWISFFEKNQPKWKRKIIKKMSEYDIIQANSEFIFFSNFSKKPLIANPIGSELRILAFKNSIRGFLMRRALKKAKVIIVSSPKQIELLQKLKLHNGVLIPYFLEFPFFEPLSTEKLETGKDLVIFHPANLDWKIKGNNVLIKGFANFVNENPNSQLIIVDRGIDSEKTHDLIKKLGIEKQINFVEGPLDYLQLKHFYKISDVVADQFILGEIGSIGREALCCQRPLLSYFNENDYNRIYENLPPILNAFSGDDIQNQLEIMQDKKKRELTAKKGREWIEKNYSLSELANKFKIIYQSILEGKKIEEIRKLIGNQKLVEF